MNKNIAALLKFVSAIAVTKRAENVSYESFRTKYYNVEHGTKDAVKVVLRNMIYCIEKDSGQ